MTAEQIVVEEAIFEEDCEVAAREERHQAFFCGGMTVPEFREYLEDLQLDAVLQG